VPGAHGIRHGADDCLGRGERVRAVAEEEVYVVCLQPRQRRLHALAHVLGRQPVLVDAWAAPEDLRRQRRRLRAGTVGMVRLLSRVWHAYSASGRLDLFLK
jgi:hypothetical protein